MIVIATLHCGQRKETFQKNAIVKSWRKRQSGDGFILGKSVN